MYDKDLLLSLLRQMTRIRRFEETLKRFYDYQGYFAQGTAAGEAQSTDDLLTCVGYDFASVGMIGGAVHLSIGQEAVAVGVGSLLRPEDAVVSSHRGHGHALAKGLDVKAALAELMGRATGCSRGCGGSMHLFDAPLSFLGGNGIVGGQVPLALGPAFAAKYRGTTQVAVAFYGEGAANQGVVHESLNLAALWKLPMLFVCENNLYANTTPLALSSPLPDIALRAAGYGIPGITADGQDVLAVREVAQEALRRARAGEGPTLIEAKTYRFEGHCGASPGLPNPGECAQWRQRDPLALLESKLCEQGLATAEELREMRDEVAAEMEAAVAFATESPFPQPDCLAEFVI